ncbi:MAG: hypothetical protein OSA49_14050, partial [Ascidiaceihabitans sp.]|nr:hypothetical protein [Ascidiaceihabitans sp.]
AKSANKRKNKKFATEPEELPQLLDSIGHTGGPVELAGVQTDIPFELANIYDSEIESAAQAAYQRDYMMFGFKSWG